MRLQQLQGEPTYSYAAFDFFVAAEHMVDWLHPNDEAKQKQTRNAHELLKICSHIASGAKHFEATRKPHRSVSGLENQGGVFPVPALKISLDGKAAMQFGPEVECLDLATAVLEYWENCPEMV
jgi:hypothetical protein